jgi:hypothetical protein
MGREYAMGANRAGNQTFAAKALDAILAKPNHPLGFLVDRVTSDWLGRSHLDDLPAVQVGHLVSAHSGAPERLALEDAEYNQKASWRGERQGVIFEKNAIEIGGVPVEKATAQLWERDGLLGKGTVNSAPSHPGWSPDPGEQIFEILGPDHSDSSGTIPDGGASGGNEFPDAGHYMNPPGGADAAGEWLADDPRTVGESIKDDLAETGRVYLDLNKEGARAVLDGARLLINAASKTSQTLVEAAKIVGGVSSLVGGAALGLGRQILQNTHDEIATHPIAPTDESSKLATASDNSRLSNNKSGDMGLDTVNPNEAPPILLISSYGTDIYSYSPSNANETAYDGHTVYNPEQPGHYVGDYDPAQTGHPDQTPSDANMTGTHGGAVHVGDYDPAQTGHPDQTPSDANMTGTHGGAVHIGDYDPV